MSNDKIVKLPLVNYESAISFRGDHIKYFFNDNGALINKAVKPNALFNALAKNLQSEMEGMLLIRECTGLISLKIYDDAIKFVQLIDKGKHGFCVGGKEKDFEYPPLLFCTHVINGSIEKTYLYEVDEDSILRKDRFGTTKLYLKSDATIYLPGLPNVYNWGVCWGKNNIDVDLASLDSVIEAFFEIPFSYENYDGGFRRKVDKNLKDILKCDF